MSILGLTTFSSTFLMGDISLGLQKYEMISGCVNFLRFIPPFSCGVFTANGLG